MSENEKICCGKCDKGADGSIKEGQECSTDKSAPAVIESPVTFTRKAPADVRLSMSEERKAYHMRLQSDPSNTLAARVADYEAGKKE